MLKRMRKQIRFLYRKWIKRECPHVCRTCACKEYLFNQCFPEIAVIVHARWLPSNNGDCIYTCSKCGFVRDAYLLEEKAYCPNCGSKMDEVTE